MRKAIKVKGHVRRHPNKWKDEAQKFLKEAKKEVKKFKNTNNEIYLRQAGEKLWECFIDFLKYKASVNVVSSRGRRYLAQKHGLISLYTEASFLHAYYYGGGVDNRTALEKVNSFAKKMERKIKR